MLTASAHSDDEFAHLLALHWHLTQCTKKMARVEVNTIHYLVKLT